MAGWQRHSAPDAWGGLCSFLERLLRNDFRTALRLKFLACRFNVAEDSEEVATEDLVHVRGRVTAGHEGLCDLRQVGGAVQTFGGRGNSIKVGTDPDVIDAGD